MSHKTLSMSVGNYEKKDKLVSMIQKFNCLQGLVTIDFDFNPVNFRKILFSWYWLSIQFNIINEVGVIDQLDLHTLTWY